MAVRASGPTRALALALALTVAVVFGGCAKGEAPYPAAARELTLGVAAESAGDLPAAREHYRRALEHDPRSKLAFYDLGLLDQRAGRMKAAETNYRRALRSDPYYFLALFNLAIVLTPSDPAGAEAMYRRAIEVAPDNANAHLNLGLLLRARGGTAEADGEVAKAKALEQSTTTTSATGG